MLRPNLSLLHHDLPLDPEKGIKAGTSGPQMPINDQCWQILEPVSCVQKD